MAPKEQVKAQVQQGFQLPAAYRIFFLLVEPLSAVAGAYLAHIRKHDYLGLTDAASAPSPTSSLPLSTSIVLEQLANMYLFCAINEALVLRSSSDVRVWKTVLFGLLVGDFGHLYTMRGLGFERYWNVTRWNAIDWGNFAFVYLVASMRLAFLAGIGLGVAPRKLSKNKKP